MSYLLEFNIVMQTWDARPLFEADINDKYDIFCMYDSGANLPIVCCNKVMFNSLFQYKNFLCSLSIDGIGGSRRYPLYQLPIFNIRNNVSKNSIDFLNLVIAYQESSVKSSAFVLLPSSMFGLMDVYIGLYCDLLSLRCDSNKINMRYSPELGAVYSVGLFI